VQSVNSAKDAFKNPEDIDKYNAAIEKAFKTFQRYQKMPAGQIID